MNNYNYYINFYRNKQEYNFFAYLIRAAENTPYNHVEICAELKNCPEVSMYYSAVIPKSRKATQKEIDDRYTLIKRRKLDVQVSDVEAFRILHKYLDKEYSILQNFVIAMALSIHQLKSYFLSVKLNLDKYLNCTEYCARFEEEACFKKFPSTESVSLKALDTKEGSD